MPNRLFRWANFLPTAPSGVNFKDISICEKSAIALDNDGYAWSIGDNFLGQLGNGTDFNSYCTWQKVCCDYQYCKVVTSGRHSFGIKTNGCLVAWGLNNEGQLGDGTTNNSRFPVSVCCNYTYIDINTGYNSSAAIKSDCSAVTWGNNGNGQLGDGTTTSRCQPTAVCCNYAYCKIAINSHTVAIKTNGCAVSWGLNNVGQIGDGTTTNRCQPVAVCCNYTYKCFMTTCAYNAFSLGIKTDGCAVGFGGNVYGVLGIGSETAQCQPAAVCCNYTYCDISGHYHVSAIKTDGCAVSWGANDAGNLGNGTTSSNFQPVAVCCDYQYCKLSVGQLSVMSIKTNGDAVSWGYNECGQLGDGTRTNRCQPVAVCNFPT